MSNTTISVKSKSIDSNWFETFKELRSYVEKNNQLPTSSSNEKLHNWIIVQQSKIINSCKGNSLSLERKELLSYITGWNQNLPQVDNEWNRMFERVKEFYKQYQRYPESFDKDNKDILEKDLYQWCEKQRYIRERAQQQKSGLHWSNEKETQLSQQQCWYWSRQESDDNYWNYRLQCLQLLDRIPTNKEENKYCQVLFKWVQQQRKLYTNKKLSKQRIEILETTIPNWSWKSLSKDIWLENYTKLVNFQQEQQRLPEQFSNDSTEQTLYKWMNHQKKRRNKIIIVAEEQKAELSLEKQQQLESITNWEWDTEPFSQWKKMFDQLVEYYTEKQQIKYDKSATANDKKICQWFRHTKAKWNKRKDQSADLVNNNFDDQKWELFNDFMIKYQSDIQATLQEDYQ